MLEPVPCMAARPEVSQGPDATECGGDEGDPLGRGVDAVAQQVAEARCEFAGDDGGAHVIRVLAPGRRVDERGDDGAERECSDGSQEDAVSAGDDDPDEQDEGERKKQMRLEGAEPKRGSGSEGVRFVEAEKESEAAEDKDGGLAEDDAEERGRKTVAEPVEMSADVTEEGPENADRRDEEGEHEERPGKSGGGGREVTERVGEREGPWSVAHVEGAGAAEAGIALDAADGDGVIRIAVLDELMTRGPVDDEVTASDDGRIERHDAEKESGKDDAERAGNGDEERCEIALAGQG